MSVWHAQYHWSKNSLIKKKCKSHYLAHIIAIYTQGCAYKTLSMNAFQLSGEIIVVPIKSLKGDRKTLRCLHEFVDRVGMKVSTLGIN